MATTRTSQRPLRVRAVHVHTASGHPATTRLITVIATLAMSMFTWALVGFLVGNDLVVVLNGTRYDVGLSLVAAVSLAASAVALVSLAVVEQLTRHARGVWTSLAVAVLLLSVSWLFGAQGPLTTRLALVVILLAAGSVLIPGVALSERSRYEPRFHVEDAARLSRRR